MGGLIGSPRLRCLFILNLILMPLFLWWVGAALNVKVSLWDMLIALVGTICAQVFLKNHRNQQLSRLEVNV